MLQSQQHIKIGARKDSKGKANMKLVGIGKKLGSCVLIKEGEIRVLGGQVCHRGFLVSLVRLCRWNQPTEMVLPQGVASVW